MLNQLQYTTTNLRTPESISSSIPSHPSGHLSRGFQKSPDFGDDTSFSISVQPDATLLTPNSATQSPQSQQTKFTTTYPTPPSCSTSLLHDTSGNSKMYGPWNSSFELHAPSSQASSPMTAQPSMGAEFLGSYDHDHSGRRTPGPPEQPYMGSFGVSDPHALHHSSAPSYYVGIHAMDQSTGHSTIMRDSPQGIPDQRGAERGHPAGSLLNHPAHIYSKDKRNSLTEPAYPNRSINGSPRSGPAIHAGRVRKPRRPKKQGSATSKGSLHDGDMLGEHMNCRGQEVPPTLKPTCPDEERCIFESRWRHRKDKGQDMWDGIQKDYQQHFGRPPPVKETLQMKFKRARSKHIEWLPEDVDKLKMAWKEMEDERYETLLHKFLKKGGSRNMLLNATDIEFKVVNDLKLEEGLYMPSFRELENMDIRRRQKANPPKKRSSGRSAAQTQQSVAVKMEPDEDTTMSSPREDEIIKQVQEARPDYDRYSDGGNSGHNQQQAVGRWGPGPGMMATSMWDNRTMPPMADQLLVHGSGPGVHRRQT